MAKIEIGQFGYNLAQSAPSPRGAQVPQTGEAIHALGAGMEHVADAMYREEAIADSTKAVLGAKQKFDEFRLTFDRNPTDEAGHPRYDPTSKDYLKTVADDVNKYGNDIADAAKKSTNNRMAQQVIEKDLSGYLESTRLHIMTQAQKQRTDANKAAVLQLADDIATNASGLPDDEVIRRHSQALAAGVHLGAIDATEAVKLQQKAKQDIVYGHWVTEMSAATSPQQLLEVQKRAENDSSLPPPIRMSISTAISTRRTQMEQETEKALKADQDGINKTLTDLKAAGQLTPKIVETFRSKLNADQYETWMSRFKTQAVQGEDDPKIVQGLTSEIRGAWKDPAKLQQLRNRVTIYGSGYDPVTKTSGSPRISRASEDKMNATIEGYLNDLRAEGRQQKSEQESAATKQYESVRGTLVQRLQVMKSAAGKDDKAAVEKVEADVLEGLAQHKSDPAGYLQQLRKDRPSLFKPPVPPALQYYVQPKGDTPPDWDAATRKLYDDYRRGFDRTQEAKKKQSLTDQYKKDFDALKRFQREWDAAH